MIDPFADSWSPRQSLSELRAEQQRRAELYVQDANPGMDVITYTTESLYVSNEGGRKMGTVISDLYSARRKARHAVHQMSRAEKVTLYTMGALKESVDEAIADSEIPMSAALALNDKGQELFQALCETGFEPTDEEIRTAMGAIVNYLSTRPRPVAVR